MKSSSSSNYKFSLYQGLNGRNIKDIKNFYNYDVDTHIKFRTYLFR